MDVTKLPACVKTVRMVSGETSVTKNAFTTNVPHIHALKSSDPNVQPVKKAGGTINVKVNVLDIASMAALKKQAFVITAHMIIGVCIVIGRAIVTVLTKPVLWKTLM